MKTNYRRNRIDITTKLDNRYFKAKVERLLEEKGSIRLQDNVGQSYLNEGELSRLIKVCKAIRQGQKLAIGAPLCYLRIDDECICLNSYAQIKSTLATCYIKREDFRVFRNFDKGITISCD
jgi:hypothetical protein